MYTRVWGATVSRTPWWRKVGEGKRCLLLCSPTLQTFLQLQTLGIFSYHRLWHTLLPVRSADGSHSIAGSFLHQCLLFLLTSAPEGCLLHWKSGAEPLDTCISSTMLPAVVGNCVLKSAVFFSGPSAEAAPGRQVPYPLFFPCVFSAWHPVAIYLGSEPGRCVYMGQVRVLLPSPLDPQEAKHWRGQPDGAISALRPFQSTKPWGSVAMYHGQPYSQCCALCNPHASQKGLLQSMCSLGFYEVSYSGDQKAL